MIDTVLLSTAYFAPIQYYCKLYSYTNIYIEIQENYSKQSYRNRCNILAANGLLSLTIPVKKLGELKILTKETVLKIIKTKKGRNSSKPLPFPISIYFLFYFKLHLFMICTSATFQALSMMVFYRTSGYLCGKFSRQPKPSRQK